MTARACNLIVALVERNGAWYPEDHRPRVSAQVTVAWHGLRALAWSEGDNGMEKEAIEQERPNHEIERMKMVPIADGAQYRITCAKCETSRIVPANTQGNGTADCTGNAIYLAWGE